MEETKTVYKLVNGNAYEIWTAPKKAVIIRPFTEKTPPNEEGKMIAGYDWSNDEWIVIEAVPKKQYDQLAQVTADLVKDKVLLKQSIDNIQAQLDELLQKNGETNDEKLSE